MREKKKERVREEEGDPFVRNALSQRQAFTEIKELFQHIIKLPPDKPSSLGIGYHNRKFGEHIQSKAFILGLYFRN